MALTKGSYIRAQADHRIGSMQPVEQLFSGVWQVLEAADEMFTAYQQRRREERHCLESKRSESAWATIARPTTRGTATQTVQVSHRS